MKYCLPFLVILFCACSKSGVGTTNVTDNGPSSVSVKADIASDSSGNVTFTPSATNAVSFNFDFGDGSVLNGLSGVAKYKYSMSGTYTVKLTAISSTGKTSTYSTQINVVVKLTLAWYDEFDKDGQPDSSKWTYDLGAGGWGNKELEYYTNRNTNVTVSGGTLKIIAVKEDYLGSSYTSARLKTQGLYGFKYGRLDISAKTPAYTGTWPGIWMLGNNITTVGWPACGEIDIMEQSGSDKNTIYGTLHYPTQANPYGDGSTKSIADAATTFHKYSTIWEPNFIKLLIDDTVYYTLTNNGALPFNQNFFVILNVAMGGTFGGSVDAGFTKDQLEIDYIRLYQ